LEFYGVVSMKGLLSLVLASAVGHAVAVPIEKSATLNRRQGLGSLASLFGAKSGGSGPPTGLAALLAASQSGTLGKFVGEPEASEQI
jgi:hypothetical protein